MTLLFTAILVVFVAAVVVYVLVGIVDFFLNRMKWWWM